MVDLLPVVLPFSSLQADLPSVGGKGANLARLSQAGFPVPGGFFVTTRGYRDFVSANGLKAKILALIPPADADPQALEQASATIRALFAAGTLPAALAAELKAAYARLGSGAVAVRSSATAEDLPEMSFAGQQDTYLNVLGEEALLRAVIDCWSSLWTARAIGYRTRNGVPHQGTALAVVIQTMVESQASGVLFTANPLTGLRRETVIDATLGLGEALVSGQVEPDHYVVEAGAGRITSKTLGAKALSIHGQAGGGTVAVEENRASWQALPDALILALANLGQQVEKLYGAPQDIEWAWANDKLYLLQSRPVTSLFPLPEKMPNRPLLVFFSFGAVQGMLDPMTPLGIDSMKDVFAMGAGLFGIRVTSQTQNVLFTAGERLWVNFTTLLTNSLGRRVVPAGLTILEPTIRQALLQILDDPRLQPSKVGVSWHARRQLASFLLPTAGNVLLNILSPRRRRERIVDQGEQVLEVMKNRAAAIQGDRYQKLAQMADLLDGIGKDHLPKTLRLFFSGVAAGMASWNFLNMLARDVPDDLSGGSLSRNDLILQVTRGMPFNPTTEMDLALWRMAKAIRSDPTSMDLFGRLTPSELAQRWLAGSLPEAASREIGQFLKRYGGRGLAEIDLGRPRWADEPTPIFEMLDSFLHIKDENLAPDAVFGRGVRAAQQAIDRLAQAVRQTRGGWIKARLVHFFAGRARQLMGMRESPKFFAVRMMGIIQTELHKTGQEFVQSGELEQADDLFYLTMDEIRAFARREAQDWRGLIAARRAAYCRELLRRQIPRLLLSDGRAFYEGMSGEGAPGAIHGSPVSPGSAEGLVRVVLDPRSANLQPGEIMVCPGTDPSWTPLFLSAAGLVMETGGMMTHGAVVAREYGIPAIVGVDQATHRLQTGQRIRINGSTGQVVVVEEGQSAS